jgi:hypothetical protein
VLPPKFRSLERARFRPSPVLLFIVLSLLPLRVSAHHNAGGGQGESQRKLGTLGSDAAQRSRAAIVLGASRSTSEPTLNPATNATAAAVLNLRLHSRCFAGLELPFILVAEDGADQVEAGYGDTRLGGHCVIVQPRPGRVALSGGVDVSLPTRTVHYSTDPGAQWVVSPNFRVTQAFERLYWFSLVHLPYEIRPAGSALELSTSLSLGYRLTESFSWVVGPSLDVRLFALCSEVDGSLSYCQGGRATEENRPTGSVRAGVHTALSYERWSIFASGGLPLTDRRDIQWSVNSGVEARFGQQVAPNRTPKTN